MKVVLFDFFGVISSPVYKIVIEKYISPEQQDVWMKKLDELDTGEITEIQFAMMIANEATVPLESVQETVKSAPIVNNELLRYIDESLRPRIRVGLLTNIPRSLLSSIMGERLHQFEPVLVSSDLKLVKPDPAIFEIAIQRSGCSPEDIIFIDDSQKNIEVAASLGITAILYKGIDDLKNKIEPLL